MTIFNVKLQGVSILILGARKIVWQQWLYNICISNESRTLKNLN